jgi:hypothetical protein
VTTVQRSGVTGMHGLVYEAVGGRSYIRHPWPIVCVHDDPPENLSNFNGLQRLGIPGLGLSVSLWIAMEFYRAVPSVQHDQVMRAAMTAEAQPHRQVIRTAQLAGMEDAVC